MRLSYAVFHARNAVHVRSQNKWDHTIVGLMWTCIDAGPQLRRSSEEIALSKTSDPYNDTLDFLGCCLVLRVCDTKHHPN